MPFKSQSQMGLCYQKKIQAEARGRESGWDCDEWLAATSDPCSLPYKKGGHSKPSAECKTFQASDAKSLAHHGGLYKGAKGGYYFRLKGVKIYVPKGSKELEWAKKKFGVRSK